MLIIPTIVIIVPSSIQIQATLMEVVTYMERNGERKKGRGRNGGKEWREGMKVKVR